MIVRSVWVALISAVVGTGLVLLGAIDPPRAVVLVVVALTISVVLEAAPAADPWWPKPPAENRPGGRKDLSELAWAAFTRDGLVTERVLRRVRLIAARRLADHGVTWDGLLGTGLDGWGRDGRDAAAHQARAAELLGPEMLAALCTARAVTPRTLDTWLRVLDHLVEAPGRALAPRLHMNPLGAGPPDDRTPEDPAAQTRSIR